MQFPLLSLADPVESAEGSIDPLGMGAIAESLAVRLVPGVRERMSRPRFLTAIALSSALAEEFDEERVAADGVSEPWQVFEWYVVEGLVRRIADDSRIGGLPGRFKAAAAIRDGVPLSAARYLKTPTVFGFHGVYRTLARDLHIEEGGRLGETGMEILAAWAEDEGLETPFRTGAGAPYWRRSLFQAIEDGLNAGSTKRSNAWEGWQFVADHFAPDGIGPRERDVIARALVSGGDLHWRGAIMDFLRGNGRAVWLAHDPRSERALHAALADRTADPELAALLRTIGEYEAFARLLQDAFEDILADLSRATGRVQPQDLARLESVRRATEEVPPLGERLPDLLTPYEEIYRFTETFNDVIEPMAPVAFAEALLAHHQRIQRNKPPEGKAPWVERFDDGAYVIRERYARDEFVPRGDYYVHAYRAIPLWSFMRDFGMVEE